MNTTIFVLVFMIGIPLCWEFYALLNQDLRTISKVWAEMGREWNPLFCYILSVLNGHFFMRPDTNLAKYLGEPAEVAVVIVIGWIIFSVFYTHPGYMPLPTWGWFLLMIFGTLVGAYAWTIGV